MTKRDIRFVIFFYETLDQYFAGSPVVKQASAYLSLTTAFLSLFSIPVRQPERPPQRRGLVAGGLTGITGVLFLGGGGGGGEAGRTERRPRPRRRTGRRRRCRRRLRVRRVPLPHEPVPAGAGRQL